MYCVVRMQNFFAHNRLQIVRMSNCVYHKNKDSPDATIVFTTRVRIVRMQQCVVTIAYRQSGCKVVCCSPCSYSPDAKLCFHHRVQIVRKPNCCFHCIPSVRMARWGFHIVYCNSSSRRREEEDPIYHPIITWPVRFCLNSLVQEETFSCICSFFLFTDSPKVLPTVLL